jgi:hypothetical protein
VCSTLEEIMMIRAGAVVFALVCGLCACTNPSHDPAVNRSVAPEPTDDLAALTDDVVYVEHLLIPPTPAMLKAALANDPDAMRDAVAADSTCHATSSCPAQFGSCASWSTSALCNSVCGTGVCLCKPIRTCDDPPETKGQDTYNSFRVCLDPNGASCTEWQSTTVTVCGC